MSCKACRHLDYNEKTYGGSCKLVEVPGFPGVRYWERQVLPYEGAPVKVQFCGQGRGRINGVFQCYNKGEMSCYDPEP